MIDRRLFLQSAGAVSVLAMGGVTLAKAPTDKRFVLIIQRGAQDGLHALPPYGDPAYYAVRPRVGLPKPGQENGVVKLDGLFGLHPELAPLRQLYASGELIALPAVATRYRKRSHFDGQNLLENGSGEPFGTTSGFLNRALLGLGDAKDRLGLTVGMSAPLILQGKAQVQSWAPSVLPKASDDFLARLAFAYSGDEVLSDTLAAAMMPAAEMDVSNKDAMRINKGKDLSLAAANVGAMLAMADGPRVAVLESTGWDHHDGLLYRSRNLFKDLARTITTLKDSMGPAWEDTVVMTVSEFGRTVRENGSAGSDHGTAGTSFLAGGAVRGGRIVGDWPGLRSQDMYQGRDLFPANSTEGLFKAVLIDHLGISEGYVEREVLPGTGSARKTEGLFRA
ncbi:DUF1501 domain-containing protein [Parvularcula lutaonensis]|uniref:DUF1501 domain-containing protein n=1 Tax=Parvularcula lutaonensis TaxID=491923 RepID=A0ABV7MGT6_9PROT|nr:DUF1501 domain-containing protein [Parvularcula lutaonensis]GGY55685.1 hypothetical protein GCM10007148_26990 [Parvularcula lutaonensis]